MNAADIFRALRDRRYANEAVLVAEVADSTGATRERRIDAIAIGCWPSRGLYTHAIEIKVTRGDLSREIAVPEKADRIVRYCDAFWIATPKGLVTNPEELPPAWGLYEVADDGAVRAARPSTPIDREPPSMGFVAALARALVAQQSDDARLARVREEARAEAWSAARDSFEAGVRDAEKRAEEAVREARSLRGALGGSLDVAAAGRLRKIVDNLSGHYGSLNAVRVNAQAVVEHADELERIMRGLLDGGHCTASDADGESP